MRSASFVIHDMTLARLGLNEDHVGLFNDALQILDNNFGWPLLWVRAAIELIYRYKAPKLSSWYAVALLARQGPGDVDKANKLLENVLTQQFLNESFVENYGSCVVADCVS